MEESWGRPLRQHRRKRETLQPCSTPRHDDPRTDDDADEQPIRDLIRRIPHATRAEMAEAIGKPVRPTASARSDG